MAQAATMTERQALAIKIQEAEDKIRKVENRIDRVEKQIEELQEEEKQQPRNVEIKESLEWLFILEHQLRVEKRQLREEKLILLNRESLMAMTEVVILDAEYNERSIPCCKVLKKREIEALLGSSFHSIECYGENKWAPYPTVKDQKDLYLLAAGGRYRIVQDFQSTPTDPLIKKDQ